MRTAKFFLAGFAFLGLLCPPQAFAVLGALDVAALDDGQPVTEADIVISPQGQKEKTFAGGKTGKGGDAVVPLEEGKYTVAVRKGGKTIRKDLTVLPGKVAHLGTDLRTGTASLMGTLCPSPRLSDPINVGSKTSVGGGVAQVAEKVAKGLVGGLLGGAAGGAPFGFGGGGNSGDGPTPQGPETQDDPVKTKQRFTDPVTGAAVLVGAIPTKRGILISTLIEKAPGKGTFQAVVLEDLLGRRMIPVAYYVYEIWLEWSIEVSWTRDTYVNGQHVSHEEGGWSEGGRQLLDRFTRIFYGDPIWKRLGYGRAVEGIKGLGTEFLVTKEQLQRRPVTVVIHITRPDEDPVTTVPFVLLMGMASDGRIILQQLPRTPVEGFCNWRLVRLLHAAGKTGYTLRPTDGDQKIAAATGTESSGAVVAKDSESSGLGGLFGGGTPTPAPKPAPNLVPPGADQNAHLQRFASDPAGNNVPFDPAATGGAAYAGEPFGPGGQQIKPGALESELLKSLPPPTGP